MSTRETQAPVAQYLRNVLCEIACVGAMTAAYPSWTDDFSRKELREVWTDAEAPLRHERRRRVTVADLRTLTDDERYMLGFGQWDETLYVVPLWAYNYIADGEILISILGNEVVKGRDKIDLDQRFGCIAFGWRP